MMVQDGDTFTRGGRRFRISMEHDPHMGAPWDEHDGHGPVREVRTTYSIYPPKRPGERVLHQMRHTAWLYDWQAACKLARKDGWNAEPFDAPGRIERAVLADFKRLQGWLQTDWHWITLGVAMLDANDQIADITHLGGIESDCGDAYIYKSAFSLADELLYPLRQQWRAALAKRRAKRELERLAAVQAAVLA